MAIKYPTIWRPFTQMEMQLPILQIDKADGVWLYDTHGRKYIDAIASWWVNVHGHSHPHLVQAVQNQVSQLSQVIFANASHKPAETLAKRLVHLYPAPMAHAFFSDDGSTSVEVALKIALQFFTNQKNPRTTFIALEGAYHGDTFGAMAISERNLFTRSFHSLLFDVQFIPVPTPENIDLVIEQIHKIHKNYSVAALITEPLIQGSAGMVMYPAQCLETLWKEAKQLGMLIIADEVMTGFGRTGTLFAAEQLSTKPDLVCLSKGLTGGTLPMGLTLCTEEIFSQFLSKDHSKTFFHGHSYTGNALACAVANASLDLFEQPETIQKIQKITQWQQEFCQAYGSLSYLTRARSQGTIFATEIQTQTHDYSNPISLQLYKKFIEKGLLIRPLGNTIYLMPPYVITYEELTFCHQAIQQVCAEIMNID